MAPVIHKAVVVGLGKSGRAAVELLLRNRVAVSVVDEGPESPHASELRAQGVPVATGGFPKEFWKNGDVVVVSPGVPLNKVALLEARAAGAALWGEVELAYRFLPQGAGPILGVTGTNGKSTTTALLGCLLEAAGKSTFTGGNFGTPFSQATTRAYDVHAVEFSSFQLEGIDSLVALGGTILNLTPDHLDRYPDMRAYGAAKAALFRNTPAHGFSVANALDGHSPALCSAHPGSKLTFSRGKAPATALGDGATFVMSLKSEERFTLRNRSLRGAHNLENAMAAALLARAYGASATAIQTGLDTFKGLPHRLESVRELNGVEWVNDSKATNVDSALVALKAFEGPVWLIAGGKGKGAPYAPLVEASARKVKGVFTLGQDAAAIAKSFEGVCPVYACETLPVAVAQAQGLARKGDTILLSPACASYDQFQNFEHRGDTFKALVRELQ